MSRFTTDTIPAGAPDELVTEAHYRLVDLPGGAGRAALITLDNGKDHTKPSTFGLGGLASLSAALDQAEAAAAAGEIVAVAVTGKPFILAVGADLTGVGQLTDREQARVTGQAGHDVFRRLGELPVPSFGLINGAAMGGGLEVALHCTYRTISSGAGMLALPEVFLGLIPGWGGAYLLPRLIGPQNAVKVVVENPLSQNRMLKAKDAFGLGIADVMLEPADFLVQSLRWAADVVTGAVVVDRPDLTADAAAWDAAVAAGRAFADAKVRGAAAAPYKALDLIAAARTSTRDEGFAAEDEALADLVMGDELRAGLYSFDLVQRRAKRPVGAPDKSLARPITKVGVVGAGLMASQLALLFVQRLEVPVVLTDLDQERVDKGVAYVHGEIAKQLAKGRLNQDKANRLTALVSGSTSKAGFADASVVIEAVFEDLKVKQQVFAEVEAVVAPECVLLTNTSSLSVTAMAENLQHPERVVGFHFFNPVALMPLLEIARAERTDDASLATAFALGKSLKKSCVLVKDAPAFVVNRLLTRFLGEVTAAFDEGTPFDVAESALDPMGLPMSPFVLLQLVGPAVAFHTSETMHQAFPDRYGISENQRRIVEAGKTVLLAWDGPTPRIADDVAELLVLGDSPSTGDEVRQRALDAIAQEIRLMLDEGVVAEPQDIDLCMLLGAGWPFHLGGITPYLDRTGTSERVTGARFLAPGVASVPTA
ncbi:MAG: enoyl-CoA hydratase/isomerase family protein [Actinobacteria bacterium]|jgi:3-hydroxyacyl-CoA dehydrogenase/enoyl-CoA hydratase/carnithine racemase|nr:enoyl-CoA hydratase/isomerase family protein [Actinomycetota bacterium]